MSNLGHTAARVAASKIIDVLLKNIGKDREKEMVKLIDLMEKYMSGEKLATVYKGNIIKNLIICLLYTSDAADD